MAAHLEYLYLNDIYNIIGIVGCKLILSNPKNRLELTTNIYCVTKLND